MADYWQEIAIANGITEPSNGSWLQAICESRGVVFEPFNTLQGFYYEQYLGSAPDAYIFEVQLFNKVTGQKSEILTFNLPLTAI